MSDTDDTQMSDDARIWVADRNCLYEDVAVVLRRAETVIPAVIGGTSAEVRDQLLVEIQGHIQRLRDVLRIAKRHGTPGTAATAAKGRGASSCAGVTGRRQPKKVQRTSV